MDIKNKLHVTKKFENELIEIRKNGYINTYQTFICWCVHIRFEYMDDYIKNKYGNNSRLLFIDIDSLMYEIKTQDISGDSSKDKEMFD